MSGRQRRRPSAPPADFVLPFDLPAIGLRGHFTRLDAVATRALAAHPLPEPAQLTLAEALALAALLGSAIKLEGRLSVQTKSDGPLDLVVSDFFAGGGLRGFARLDDKRFAALAPQPPQSATLVGTGILAITIEPKPGAGTYQGIVPLAPDGLAASAEAYFAQSEQLTTMLRLAAGPVFRAATAQTGESHGWCAGGLMVQAMPNARPDVLQVSDDWRRIALFLKTLEDYELLDTAIPAEDVLWRLFHEDEVRLHAPQPLHFHCGCGPEKVASVLRSYSAGELRNLADPDGMMRTRCEFCGTVYEFPLNAFDRS